jgi:hypothetical protein
MMTFVKTGNYESVTLEDYATIVFSSS